MTDHHLTTRYRQAAAAAAIRRHLPNDHEEAHQLDLTTASAGNLRGIPAIGRDCPGAIPGTQPEHALLNHILRARWQCHRSI